MIEAMEGGIACLKSNLSADESLFVLAAFYVLTDIGNVSRM